MSSAGWPVRFIARRRSAMRLTTPVDVSLCTTTTAFSSRARVVFQPLLERFRRRASAPRAWHVLDDEAEPLRDLPPRDVREPAGFENQNAIAGRQRIDERRFGGAGTRRRKNHDRVRACGRRLSAARAPRGQARRTRVRGDRSSPARSLSAHDRERSSALESAGNDVLYVS